MNKVATILLLLLASAAAEAQVATPQTEPLAVSVVKYSWSKERVGWQQDPFGGPIENFDEMRVRSRNEKRIMDAKKGGNNSEVSRAERDAKTDQALISTIHQNSRARYGFVYKASVQNNSDKTIKSIDWDYVFYDLGTESEVGRRQFTSEQKISPGRTKELSFFIPNPPTQTISVEALEKHERDGLGERIELVRVEFSDGTTWQQR